MVSLVEEIQSIADNPDKCINYPIGDKLEAFMRWVLKLKPLYGIDG